MRRQTAALRRRFRDGGRRLQAEPQNQTPTRWLRCCHHQHQVRLAREMARLTASALRLLQQLSAARELQRGHQRHHRYHPPQRAHRQRHGPTVFAAWEQAQKQLRLKLHYEHSGCHLHCQQWPVRAMNEDGIPRLGALSTHRASARALREQNKNTLWHAACIQYTDARRRHRNELLLGGTGHRHARYVQRLGLPRHFHARGPRCFLLLRRRTV